jgi:hypothetical protein
LKDARGKKSFPRGWVRFHEHLRESGARTAGRKQPAHSDLTFAVGIMGAHAGNIRETKKTQTLKHESLVTTLAGELTTAPDGCIKKLQGESQAIQGARRGRAMQELHQKGRKVSTMGLDSDDNGVVGNWRRDRRVGAQATGGWGYGGSPGRGPARHSAKPTRARPSRLDPSTATLPWSLDLN